MRNLLTRAAAAATAAALLGSAACQRSASAADELLARDLAAAGASTGDIQLAPRSAGQQMVVSAVEAGPGAAPIRAAARRSTAPRQAVQPRRTRTAATRTAVAPAPAPVTVATEPAPSRSIEPPPLPPATRGPTSRQPGTYKTEAEIFRQMPWIKP